MRLSRDEMKEVRELVARGRSTRIIYGHRKTELVKKALDDERTRELVQELLTFCKLKNDDGPGFEGGVPAPIDRMPPRSSGGGPLTKSEAVEEPGNRG